MTESADLVRPLTARSAILSVLLGAHPPSAPAGEIVEWGRQVGIAETTVRAALSRMVKAGDLVRRGTDYKLADRLLERQRWQDVSLLQPLKPWDGQWIIVLVVSVGNDAATRLQLRRTMIAEHFAEVREGAWVRPDNLDRSVSGEILQHVEVMSGCPSGEPVAFARRLFDLEARAKAGRSLLARARKVKDPSDRLSTVASIVRYLVLDPQLPHELLPKTWPVPELRRVHARFSGELMYEREQLKQLR